MGTFDDGLPTLTRKRHPAPDAQPVTPPRPHVLFAGSVSEIGWSPLTRQQGAITQRFGEANRPDSVWTIARVPTSTLVPPIGDAGLVGAVGRLDRHRTR